MAARPALAISPVLAASTAGSSSTVGGGSAVATITHNSQLKTMTTITHFTCEVPEAICEFIRNNANKFGEDFFHGQAVTCPRDYEYPAEMKTYLNVHSYLSDILYHLNKNLDNRSIKFSRIHQAVPTTVRSVREAVFGYGEGFEPKPGSCRTMTVTFDVIPELSELFDTMQHIVDTTCTAYATDFTLHDREMLAARSSIGSGIPQFLWMCRNYGTHIDFLDPQHLAHHAFRWATERNNLSSYNLLMSDSVSWQAVLKTFGGPQSKIYVYCRTRNQLVEISADESLRLATECHKSARRELIELITLNADFWQRTTKLPVPTVQ